MRIEFNNYEAAKKFYYKLQEDGMKLEMVGENYTVMSLSLSVQHSMYCAVELTLVHTPKRVEPTWSFGEDMLKDLRQKNSSLLKFTEKAIALYVSSGDAEKYLAKYNRDGTVR
jgi:hypothetical protein